MRTLSHRLPGRLALGASAFFLGLAAAGCGNTTGERAVSGGAIGAAAGGATSAAAGGSAATGAVLGGALGAATGAVTDSGDIDLD